MKKMEKMKINLNTVAVTLAAVALVGSVVAMGFSCVNSHKNSVGVINFNAVREKAKVFTMIAQEQQKYDAVVKEKMDKELAPLQARADKLEKEKANMTGSEISKEMTSLQKKALDIQMKYRPELERNAIASQLAVKVIEPQMEEAVHATAKKENMSMVILNAQIVSVEDKSVDVTDTFVKELDKIVTTVKYPDPAKLGLGVQ